MRKVFKYELPIGDVFTLSLPEGAELLSVQVQNGVPCLWALVDPDAELEDRRFRMAGTGHPIFLPVHRLRYIDTVQLYGGDIVFHLFEIGNFVPQAIWAGDPAEEPVSGGDA